MKTYYLKRKESDTDIIIKFDTDDYFTACEYFAGIKKLSVDDLLKIYVVVCS
jgi:hypothetical protein